MNRLTRYQNLLDFPIEGVWARPNYDLTKKTTMRTQARCAMMCEINDPRGLQELLKRARQFDWPLMVLGGGANTLFATSYFDGVVVMLGRPFSEVVQVEPGVLRAGAGAKLPGLIASARANGLMGLEFLTMVPGQVGGAVAGNAGAGGEGICDLIERAVVMGRNGRVYQLRRGDFDYGYRACDLKEVIILEADLRLSKLDERLSEARAADFKSKKKNQPYDLPSSGCIFKNPMDVVTRSQVSAGKLIDEAGLKTMNIGDAVISDGHANFIVNKGTATGEDFLALVSMIQDELREKKGIELELEVNVVGGPLGHHVVLR